MFACALVHGRFEPFHLGHAALVETALQCAQQVLVLVGNCDLQDERHPWSYEQRRAMIRASFPDRGRVLIAGSSFLAHDPPLPLWGQHMHQIACQKLGQAPGLVVAGPSYSYERWAQVDPQPWLLSAPTRIGRICGTEVRQRLARNQSLQGLVSNEVQALL